MSGPIPESDKTVQSLVLKGLGLEMEGRSLLQGVDLTLPGRGVTVIFGRSGTGKTTLLRALSQLTPFSGEIFLGDKPAASFKPETLRRRLQYLHQEPSLFPGTVRHNLLLPFSFKKNPLPQPSESLLVENLQVLGLDEDILGQDALRLSGGEKQRVALVRSLLLEPNFLLLDEPTSAMDVASEDLTLQVLRQLGQKTGVIMVSHSVQLITTADRALLLADGSLREITENLDRASVQKLVEDG